MVSAVDIVQIFNSFLKNQIPLFTLRVGLDGKLTNIQKKISKLLNVHHITYEHSHPVANSKGMLERTQTWSGFFKILLKDLFKFYLRSIRHFFH